MLQYFFIVVAPVILAIAIYVCLSRLISLVGARYSPLLKPRTILIIFLTCDVVATIMQIAGAAMIGAAESNGKSSETPNNILLAGLAFQVFSFAIFMGLLSKFIISAWKPLGKVRVFTIVLAVAALLVWIRTIFRLVETAEGVLGYLSSHEVFFGVLEFAPIVVAVLILAIWHPGRCVEAATNGGTEGMLELEKV